MDTEQVTENARKKYTHAKKKTVNFFAIFGVAALLAIVMFTFGYCSHKVPFIQNENRTLAAVLSNTLENSSDLITQKYSYNTMFYDQDIKKLNLPFGKISIKLPFSKKRILFSYSGTVSAGYDVSKIDIAVKDSKKEIWVGLPKLKLIASEIDFDSFKKEFEENGLFNRYTTDDIYELEKEMQNNMEKTAMKDKEFVKRAEENAETIIFNLISSTGKADGYDLIFDY